MPGPIQTSPAIPQLPAAQAWKVVLDDMHVASDNLAGETVPAVATSAASSAALHATRVLQSATFDEGSWQADADAARAVDVLASAGGTLSIAPSAEAIATVRDQFQQVADLAAAHA